MSSDLSKICEDILNAKQREEEAKAERYKLEAEFISLVGFAENKEGSETVKPDGFKVVITGKTTREVDGDLLQIIAKESGLTEHLESLFRWKPQINLTVWRATDQSITDKLAAAITAKPGKPGVKITRI